MTGGTVFSIPDDVKFHCSSAVQINEGRLVGRRWEPDKMNNGSFSLGPETGECLLQWGGPGLAGAISRIHYAASFMYILRVAVVDFCALPNALVNPVVCIISYQSSRFTNSIGTVVFWIQHSLPKAQVLLVWILPGALSKFKHRWTSTALLTFYIQHIVKISTI